MAPKWPQKKITRASQLIRTIKVQKKKKKKKVNKNNDISLELKKTWKTQNNFHYPQGMLRIGSIYMRCS